jgi:hypothetical protein
VAHHNLEQPISKLLVELLIHIFAFATWMMDVMPIRGELQSVTSTCSWWRSSAAA